MENLNLFVKSIFIDNMIFAYFLGMCSYLAVSKNVKTAFGLGIAVTFVLAITLPVNYLLETYVLKAGALKWLGAEYAQLDLSFLSLIMFIAIIASMVQLVEMFVEKYSPSCFKFPLYFSLFYQIYPRISRAHFATSTKFDFSLLADKYLHFLRAVQVILCTGSFPQPRYGQPMCAD